MAVQSAMAANHSDKFQNK